MELVPLGLLLTVARARSTEDGTVFQQQGLSLLSHGPGGTEMQLSSSPACTTF